MSGLFKELGKRITTGDYDRPTFRVDLLSKDVALAMKMARDAKAEILLSALTQEMNELAQ